MAAHRAARRGRRLVGHARLVRAPGRRRGRRALGRRDVRCRGRRRRDACELAERHTPGGAARARRARRAPRRRVGDQHRATSPHPSTCRRCGRSCRCRCAPTRCSTSPAAGAASGHRSAAASTTAPTCVRHAAAAPVMTPPCCSWPGRPASAGAPVRSGPCTRRGAATTSTSSRRCPRAPGATMPSSVAASCSHPARCASRPGETYTAPTVVFVHSADGLDGLSRRLHRSLRARRGHPARPRPVVLNTWEAVYLETDLDQLMALADTAARIGVERFVLDDGWFGGRRARPRRPRRLVRVDDVWPEGLARSSTMSRVSVSSSGCGSSPRWSTGTATSCARTRTGCCARRPARRASGDASSCST